MNVISEEYMEADNGLSTYVIVIQNFRKKLREARGAPQHLSGSSQDLSGASQLIGFQEIKIEWFLTLEDKILEKYN